MNQKPFREKFRKGKKKELSEWREGGMALT
jgi:hypothetical protein